MSNVVYEAPLCAKPVPWRYQIEYFAIDRWTVNTHADSFNNLKRAQKYCDDMARANPGERFRVIDTRPVMDTND